MEQGTNSDLTEWQQRWLAEAVRPGHSAVPDGPAEQYARERPGSAEQRILRWAGFIARREHLVPVLMGWRQRAMWMLLALLALALVAGFMTALAVLGDGSRQVNVIWALGALLGTNLLLLAIWLLSFLVSSGNLAQGLSLGRLWFSLSGRVERGLRADHKRGINVARAFAILTTQAGLHRWWLGTVSHLVWLFALLGATLGLLLALSLRSYVFVWETTILPPAAFEALIRATGWLPGLAGFTVPDAAMVQDAGISGAQTLAVQADLQRRAWASWLIGCLLIYGVIPRAVLGMACATRVMMGLSGFRLPVYTPAWSALAARLSPDSEQAGVTDPAPAQQQTSTQQLKVAESTAGLLTIGFEPGENQTWRPEGFPDRLEFIAVDSREDRQRVMLRLQDGACAGVLFVCRAAQSPDRGSLHWLADAMKQAAAVRIWLRGAEQAVPERVQAWIQGLQDIGVPATAIFSSDKQAVAWLETGS